MLAHVLTAGRFAVKDGCRAVPRVLPDAELVSQRMKPLIDVYSDNNVLLRGRSFDAVCFREPRRCMLLSMYGLLPPDKKLHKNLRISGKPHVNGKLLNGKLHESEKPDEKQPDENRRHRG